MPASLPLPRPRLLQLVYVLAIIGWVGGLMGMFFFALKMAGLFRVSAEVEAEVGAELNRMFQLPTALAHLLLAVRDCAGLRHQPLWRFCVPRPDP